MNWSGIKEKYPKSIAILRDTEHYDMKEPRRLYDFFDEQKIFISTQYDRAYEFFNVLITNENSKTEFDYWVEFPDTFPTRTKAEEQAFLKAFEILEQKLNA